MNIYIGNLAYSLTEAELKTAFAEFGEVKSANIIKDRESGRSKGFAFVEMPDDVAAQKAIAHLNDKPLGGRPAKVNQAKPRAERPPKRRSY